jgi:hypothetical protein
MLQGQMGWVTVNFLVNYFTGRSGDEEQGNSCGALDWGGASSQITHQVSLRMQISFYNNQCVSGPYVFGPPWIRIRIRNLFVRIRILPSTITKMKKNLGFLLFCDFLMTFNL